MQSCTPFYGYYGPRWFSRRLAPVLAWAAMAAALGCSDGPQAPTTPAEPAAPALAAASATTALSFIQVSLGFSHTCGVTTDNRAYCWGGNNYGQLGNGTTTYTTSQTTPVAVEGGLRFRHVSAGYDHTCGLTTGDRVYCWGLNMWGQVGDGTKGGDNWRTSPVPVAGDRRFRQVRAGWSHTCAITPTDVAFCWGYNGHGQLGDGTITAAGRAAPVRVLGGLRWSQLTGGGEHTCGVTTGNRLYCWGLNENGQLGDGSTTERLAPRAVSGGREYRQVDAGGLAHTCATSTADVAYCWGWNGFGQLGDGTTTQRPTPGAVAGLRRFDHLNAGHYHTCGVTLAGRTFCWGRNDQGQLGDGTTAQHLKPVQTGVGLDMRQVSGGLYHTCGVTTADRAYCWGAAGLLGDGTTIRHLTPVPVAAPQ